MHSKRNAENYQEWLESRHVPLFLGQDGLVAWDAWSKQSEKYETRRMFAEVGDIYRRLTAANKITIWGVSFMGRGGWVCAFIRPAPRKRSHPIM